MKRNLTPKLLTLAIGLSSLGFLAGCDKPADTEVAVADGDAGTEVATDANATATPASTIPTQGVSDNEILVGGLHDLSGIFAAFSNPAINAANMYFDEVNANGGVNGRQIKYITEDHGYQVPKAVQATNKLVNRDKVFAMLMNLGTPHNLAAFPIMDKNDVPNVAPMTYARAMTSEGAFNRRYTSAIPYYDTMVAGVDYLVKNEGAKNLCAMYIPSDFGEETLDAVKTVAEANADVNLVQESSHRPDETDFSGTMGKFKDAGCDVVAVALGVRAAISAVGTAKAMGWDDVKFIAPITGFHPAVAGAPGGITEGMYAMTYWDYTKQQADPTAQAWATKYKETFNEDVTPGAIIGSIAAQTFVEGLKNAGADLTADSFNAGLEQVDFVEDASGVHIKMGSDDHMIAEEVYLAQVQNGDWVTVAQVGE